MATDLTDVQARLRDAEATLLAVELTLIRAEEQGELISTRAVREALDLPAAGDVHRLVIPAWPTYLLRHPEGCLPGCAVDGAAKRTLTLAHYTPATYECWVGKDGWLCTTTDEDVTP